jgi:hypothetical protein
MADEHAASARSMPQTTNSNFENTSNHQVPELEPASIEAEVTGQLHLDSHTVDPASRCKGKAKFEGIESSTSSESTPDAQTSQHLPHDPGSHDALRPTTDNSQERSSGCSHVANPHEERDLERGEPRMPPPDDYDMPPVIAAMLARRVFLPTLLKYNEFRLGASSPTEHEQSLIDSLRSIAGNNGEDIPQVCSGVWPPQAARLVSPEISKHDHHGFVKQRCVVAYQSFCYLLAAFGLALGTRRPS